MCYDFNERRIVPTHYTIRTHGYDPGGQHPKSWLVEAPADGKKWRAVAREKNSTQLNNSRFAGGFTIAAPRECRFIRLVNIGRNHHRDDCLSISVWEIFGSLID
jgi:hypothetical protein